MSSVSVEVKPFRFSVCDGITNASMIEVVAKGRECMVFIDESEDGHYVQLRDCLKEVCKHVDPTGTKVLAYKDADKQWYEIIRDGRGVRSKRVSKAGPNCSGLEIPYFILIEEEFV